MLVTKNTYGVTSVFKAKESHSYQIGGLSGSSEGRKKQTEEEFIKRLLERPLIQEKEVKERKPRMMSKRTKSKIRRKVIAFARVHKKLSFLTLTFVNQVEEDRGVKILGKFLDNVSKRSKDFQYIWVAEKQAANKTFPNNIHFHLMTNKYWKIDRWWRYWIELQGKAGIVPRNIEFSPSSAFDVKCVCSNNVKAIANYLTSYITKNEAEFKCQVWNCSKKISRLMTDFYQDISFIKNIDRLEAGNLLGGERKVYQQEYCAVHTIPLNQRTLKLYSLIDVANKKMWFGKKKEVGNES